MIEKTLKTTEGKLRVKIPSQLNELTLGQLMAMQEKPNLSDTEAISILSGIPVDELQLIKDAHELLSFGDTVLSLSYQIRYLYNSDAIPAEVIFINPAAVKNGKDEAKKVKVIKNLSVEPAGAFMAARDIIAEEISAHIGQYGQDNWQEHFNPSLTACCQVLAHYFYCRVTGKKYNEYKAEEFTAAVKKLRVTEALPIAKHFFTCYPSLSKPKISCWHRLLLRLKKEPAYRYLKNLNISTP